MPSGNAIVSDEALSVLQIICTAGGAREAFNGDLNEVLERLREAGYLVTDKPIGRFYRPTQRGLNLLQKAAAKGAA